MPETAPASALEQRALDVVQALVNELDAGRALRVVTLDASLDRDLAIGSLERVELLLRLEATCGVRLGDHVMANAGTVADLVRAMGSAGPAPFEVADEDPSAAAANQGAGVTAPASARTLIEVLRWHVDHSPDRVHIFLSEDEGREQQLTYAQLWDEASGIAAGLRARGVAAGECVALMLRTERAFFGAYFGTLLAGAVPVPLYPPFRVDQIEEYAQRQAAILRNAEARVLLTFDRVERLAGLLRPLAPSLAAVTTATDLGGPAEPSLLQSAAARSVPADSLALIQYTSGSTGTPKGVALSHANLLANIRAFGRALGVRPDDVGVSWLPLYHDMGLIGMWLGALYHGVPVAIMSPLAFLSRPSRWLRALHRHRGTLSAAPNFAFDLCVRKIPDEELAGLDLGSWRAALNGAEAVGADTIARFAARFAPHGFRPEAMCPVYGLAETSLCLTVPEMGTVPRVDRIAREPFQRSREIRPARPGEPAVAFVGCGRPVPTTEMRIVDARGCEVGERVEGRMQFRGPSATRGYHRHPEATAELFDDGWLDTGDLGYWAEGHIHVTGRRKDVIIAGGRNLYPQEIEAAIGNIPGIRHGCVAAFGSYDPGAGTERLVVVAESRERDPAACDRLAVDASRRVVDLVGIPADAVVVVPPGAIPKTSSGKIRRSATRDLYERGELLRTRASVARQWAWLLLANVGWHARRALRWTGSALFTAYLWLIVGAGLPVLRVLVLMAGPPPRGSAITRAWCRTLFLLSTYPVTYRGTERLAGLGGAVFVANHASYLDALLLRAALPAPVRFAAKSQLLSHPFLGAILRSNDVIPVVRGSGSVAEDLAGVVRRGESFAIFPEGTFTRAPGLLPFRLGAFRVAVDTGCPIVPVALRGTRAAWPDETLLQRRHPLEVIVGEPIHPQGTGWSEMVRLRDGAREALAREVGETAFQYHTPDSLARASGQAL